MGVEHDYFSLAPWSYRAGAPTDWLTLSPVLIEEGWWRRRRRESCYVDRLFGSTDVHRSTFNIAPWHGVIEDGAPHERPLPPPRIDLLYTPFSLPRHSVHPWAGAVEQATVDAVQLAAEVLAAYLPRFAITVRTEATAALSKQAMKTDTIKAGRPTGGRVIRRLLQRRVQVLPLPTIQVVDTLLRPPYLQVDWCFSAPMSTRDVGAHWLVSLFWSVPPPPAAACPPKKSRKTGQRPPAPSCAFITPSLRRVVCTSAC